jgi:hypothetical protein
VSEVTHHGPTFLALYDEGKITADQIDRFVAAWHESGDQETRELHEYLGMTWEEYDVLLMTERTLPLIVAARRAGKPLRDLVEPFFQEMLEKNDPNDRAARHTMSYWLYGHAPST